MEDYYWKRQALDSTVFYRKGDLGRYKGLPEFADFPGGLG
jgi:hypothetical protein